MDADAIIEREVQRRAAQGDTLGRIDPGALLYAFSGDPLLALDAATTLHATRAAVLRQRQGQPNGTTR
jgi:hypothetical protein